MKLNCKINAVNCEKNHFDGGEISIELTPAEALSIGAQLKEFTTAINNGNIIDKLPEFFEMFMSRNSVPNQQATPTPVSISVPNPPQPPQHQIKPDDFCEVKDAKKEAKDVRMLSMQEIESKRKRAERQTLNKLWENICDDAHNEHDNDFKNSHCELSWENGSIIYDKDFPELKVEFKDKESNRKIQLLIFASKDGKYEIKDLNNNLDLYEHDMHLTFFQKKIMQRIDALFKEQLGEK